MPDVDRLASAGRPDGLGPTVVFDIDGTLLDSAAGIVAGFQHALSSVGFEPPDAERLRSDLGPPVGLIFSNLGLPEADIEAAVLAYRRFYLAHGVQQSAPYDGVLEVLEQLRAAGVRLGTATAKRTHIAQAIIDHHGLSHYFVVVNGTDDLRSTKTATLAYTLELMGGPAASDVVMVGDRHSDISAARDLGVLPVGVTWGYGTRAELEPMAALLIDQPQQLLQVPPVSAAVGMSTRAC
ncbi:MAG: HAD hydrolase-like protein [Propionibacteriaceae bacterium]